MSIDRTATADPRNGLSEASEAPEAQALFVLAYNEIKKLARHVKQGRGPATLNTTALVHEAFLKVRGHAESSGTDAEHLKALVTRAMRQILVDHSRKQQADKRGSGAPAISLSGIQQAGDAVVFDLVAVDRALSELEALNTRLARVVELYVFAGLAVPEIAQLLDLTERTVFRDWRKARAFLIDRLG